MAHPNNAHAWRWRAARWCAALCLLAACDSDGSPGATADATTGAHDADAHPDVAPEPLVFCDGPTRFTWAPDTGQLDAYPDDYWSVPDADTRTGRRLDIPEDAPFLADVPALFAGAYADLNALDGWGTHAAVVLSFDAPMSAPPSGPEASLAPDAPIQLWSLPDDGPPSRAPFEITRLEGDHTLLISPLRPLPPKTRHGVIVTTDFADTDGACARPSDALIAVLEGRADDPRLEPLSASWATLLDTAALAPDDVSAGVVFTTQSTWDAAADARDAIAASPPVWAEAPECEPEGALRRCEGVFTARDFRVEGDLHAPLPEATYDLPVTIWLPAAGDGPRPVVLFGHGLGGGASQAAGPAGAIGQAGAATLAVSAPRHGDHPTRRPGAPNAAVLDFFGVDAASFAFESFQFRENMRQAAFDKLQVLALLTADADVDGDGAGDLDMARVAYWGASLGAIMGADLLALSDQVSAAVLTVGGGRMGQFITESGAFGQLRPLLASLFGGEEALALAIPIAQTLLDAGDPASLAPRVLRDRLDAGQPPHVLVQMVIGDDVVPNSTTRYLARALGVTHLAPVLDPVGVIDVADEAPLRANVEGGVTAGLFQLDRVRMSLGDAPVAATHDNIFQGIEGLEQAIGFLASWRDGAAEIRDPYADLDTPPRP